MSSSTLLDRPAATDPGSGLSALRQTLSLVKGMLACEPLEGDDPHSFNLINPSSEDVHCFSLEARSHQLFSGDHMQTIIADPTLLLKFTAFLSTKRPLSISILIYYLDAHKSLKAITYANAITYGLKPIREHHFTLLPPAPTSNAALEAKARNAFDALVNQELPAYITHLYIQLVSTRITKRITGTLAPHLRETSEGLAEVFCLTDPSRPDNPIVFSSEGTRCSMVSKFGGDLLIVAQSFIEPLSMVSATSSGETVASFRAQKQASLVCGGSKKR